MVVLGGELIQNMDYSAANCVRSNTANRMLFFAFNGVTNEI